MRRMRFVFLHTMRSRRYCGRAGGEPRVLPALPQVPDQSTSSRTRSRALYINLKNTTRSSGEAAYVGLLTSACVACYRAAPCIHWNRHQDLSRLTKRMVRGPRHGKFGWRVAGGTDQAVWHGRRRDNSSLTRCSSKAARAERRPEFILFPGPARPLPGHSFRKTRIHSLALPK